MTSPFDPKAFAQMTFTDANSTVSVPCPVGEWPFTVTKSEITTWSTKDGSKSGLKCNLTMESDDPAVNAVTGRDKTVLKHEMMLDLTPEGGLDFGKGMNVNLGRAREACGLNKPGVPFNFDMFIGHTVKASVKHRPFENRLLAEVSAIVATASGYTPGG